MQEDVSDLLLMDHRRSDRRGANVNIFEGLNERDTPNGDWT